MMDMQNSYVCPLYMHYQSHFSLTTWKTHSFCMIIVIITMFLTEWDPQVSDFCLLLFTLVSCRHVIMCGDTTSRQRQHLCKKKEKKIWTTSEGAPPYLRNSGAFQASGALYSGIISGFRWTEEPRCIWPLSVQNSIKAKPDLLHLSPHSTPSLFLLISLQFTALYWHECYMRCIVTASANKLFWPFESCILYVHYIYWWIQLSEPFDASLIFIQVT